jgi:hypothetical protein
MVDVSGIPNMGFGGSPAPFAPGGSFGTWSADQINSSMGMGPGGAGDFNQAVTNNLYGPRGFGGDTAYYAGEGAAYGRATGGFGGEPGRVGTIGNPGTSNPGYNDYGGGADYNWVQGGSQGARPSSVWGQGAKGFEYGGTADIDWMKAGSQGTRPSEEFSSRFGGGGGGDTYNQFGQNYAPPQAQTPYPMTDPLNSSGYGGGGGGGAWNTSNQFGQPYAPPRLGGAEDQAWVRGGSQGARPSTGLTFGGNEDMQWYLGGSQGVRPSIDEGWSQRPGAPQYGLAGNPSVSNEGYGSGNRLSGAVREGLSPPAPAMPQSPAYPMWGNGATIPDYNGDMWGGRNAIANAMMQQGVPYPDAGGFDPSKANVFNSAGRYQEQPGGWMTTGDPGAGIDGWGYGGAQAQGQVPPWRSPFDGAPAGG